jgi:hypothetical protein
MEEIVQKLSSRNPKERFAALVALRANHSPGVGDELVQALLRERDDSIWWFSVMCVLPSWLPHFDNMVIASGRWPFSGSQTLRIIELSHTGVIHSFQPTVAEWTMSSDWTKRFAVFRWLKSNGTMDQAVKFAKGLLPLFEEDFLQHETTTSDGVWMNTFWRKEQRFEEVAMFLLQCGEVTLDLD